MIELHLLPARSDNYIHLLREPASSLAAVVDPSDAAPVIDFLEARSWKLAAILNTHHHGDHVGGNRELAGRYGCRIYGSASDRARIPGITEALRPGDTFELGRERVEVFGADGHTRGHIVYWLPASRLLFVGDTIFSLGCGKLFEGSPQEMWAALSALRALPDDARICCAHEYTLENAEFARRVEPGNSALTERIREAEAQRKRGEPTVPTTLGSEKACNPFLRPESEEIRKSVRAVEGEELWQVFARIREAKDRFDGGGVI